MCMLYLLHSPVLNPFKLRWRLWSSVLGSVVLHLHQEKKRNQATVFWWFIKCNLYVVHIIRFMLSFFLSLLNVTHLMLQKQNGSTECDASVLPLWLWKIHFNMY